MHVYNYCCISYAIYVLQDLLDMYSRKLINKIIINSCSDPVDMQSYTAILNSVL